MASVGSAITKTSSGSELIACLRFIGHGPHRKRLVLQFYNWCMCSLPRERVRLGFVEYAIEIGPDDMLYQVSGMQDMLIW
jgi:hypothetical protein